MGVDAFVLSEIENSNQQVVANHFASAFLVSPDFDLRTLKSIGRNLGMGRESKKKPLADSIAEIVVRNPANRAMVIAELCERHRQGLALWIGQTGQTPRLGDPAQLVVGRGESKWYGPVFRPTASIKEYWYVRPMFVPHLREDASGDLVRDTIRWLCFARVDPKTAVSLHWRGFSAGSGDGVAPGSVAQFPYWKHIPELFKELASELKGSLKPVKWHTLVFHDLWPKLRRAPGYQWVDQRVNAESEGMALSARAGSFKAEGLRNLVSKLHVSVVSLLKSSGVKLPKEGELEELLMATLLREYGTISYGFRLADSQQELFNAHVYFGLRVNGGVDAFPHLILTKVRDINQLQFVLQYAPAHAEDQTKVFLPGFDL